jgi:hypothetical protein
LAVHDSLFADVNSAWNFSSIPSICSHGVVLGSEQLTFLITMALPIHQMVLYFNIPHFATTFISNGGDCTLILKNKFGCTSMFDIV